MTRMRTLSSLKYIDLQIFENYPAKIFCFYSSLNATMKFENILEYCNHQCIDSTATGTAIINALTALQLALQSSVH